MKDKKLRKLLKYEVEHIRWIYKIEKGITNLFGVSDISNTPNCCNYTLMFMVLDDLDIPKDCSETPRDGYNDIYYEFYTDPNNRDYDKLLKNFKELKGEDMKTRQGFVSNSSSTSFCIYGTIVKEELDKDTFLEYFYGDPNSYERNIYMGLEYTSMNDDETPVQFKERIKNEIKRLLGEEGLEDISIHEESYYDG